MIFLRIILYPFSFIFRCIIFCRNFLFDKGIFKSHKIESAVISVGNISAGGSGKTPAVNMIAAFLKSTQRKPAVLSRGYGRKTKGYVFVSDGKKMFAETEVCGDEIYMTSSEQQIPAAVCENRVKGALRLIEDSKADTIILDDAFQHRWIQRDLNILVFDQKFLVSNSFLDHSLLPAGFLREPFNSAKRADMIIINRKFADRQPIPDYFKKYIGRKKIFTAYYKQNGLFDVRNHNSYLLEEFEGQKGLVVSGVANPASFLQVLNSNNIDTENKLVFRDHKNYSDKEIQLIRKYFYSTNSHCVITTHKDAVKLMNYKNELDDIDIFYLKIEMICDEENEFKDFLLSKI